MVLHNSGNGVLLAKILRKDKGQGVDLPDFPSGIVADEPLEASNPQGLVEQCQASIDIVSHLVSAHAKGDKCEGGLTQ